MLTNKQTVNVYGFNIDARYSYSSAFKFFAYANAAGAGCSVLSLLVVLLSSPWPGTYFCMFLHDMSGLDGLELEVKEAELLNSDRNWI
ncbi:hypothetical protein ACH5RR_025249 [Cinchona calisaya]|uniref:CASP-like protein n=1 Tax=Cinchona calisaya TaxID=153742 RepID=A0ABD2YZ30_9GENT